MKWLSSIAFLIFFSAGRLASQSLVVYPGDVTNNGVVNNLDFLYLGMAYNFAGPARDSGALVFGPQAAAPWAYSFASGLNMAYADCNGDGVVNYYYDAFPLYTYYGLQRNGNVTPDVFIAGLAGVDPPLQFDHAAAPALVQGGQLVSLPIELGAPDFPAEDVYGIAFSMVVDPQLVNTGSVMFNFSENSWANPDNDRIWMYKKVSNQRVDVAWVRTDRNQKRGAGRIGYVEFVIIVDVVALQNQQFPVRITDIKMMDKFGNYATVAGDTVWLTVMPDSATSGTRTTPPEPQVSVMPNPAADQVLIRATETIQDIVLTDMLGQVVYSEQQPGADLVALSLPKLPPGTYLLRVKTDRGIVFRKLQIQ